MLEKFLLKTSPLNRARRVPNRVYQLHGEGRKSFSKTRYERGSPLSCVTEEGTTHQQKGSLCPNTDHPRDPRDLGSPSTSALHPIRRALPTTPPQASRVEPDD